MLRKLFTLFFFILVTHFTQGQIIAADQGTDIALFKDLHSIADNALIYVDTNNTHTAQSINENNWKKFSAIIPDQFIPINWIGKTIYFKFALQNSNTSTDTVFFCPGNSFQSIGLYKLMPQNNLLLIPDLSKKNGFQPLVVAAQEKAIFIAALVFTKRKFNLFNPQIVQKTYIKQYETIYYTIDYYQLVIGYLLSGLLGMMVLFNFFNFVNFIADRKAEFFYNALYAASMFLLIFINTYYERRSGIFASFFMGYFAFAILITGNIFYLAFTRKFLNTKPNYPQLDKIFYYSERCLMVLLVLYTYLYFYGNNFLLQSGIENGTKIILLVLGMFYIVVGLRQKDKLFKYLVYGNICLIIFSLISFMVIVLPITRTGIFTSAILYYELGIVGEMISFLLGLIYKNKRELTKQIEEKETLKRDAEKQIFEARIAMLNIQQTERNRISADMHDDLGSGVTAIRLFSELAKNRLGKNTIPEIDKISSSANELLNNMNAIIWTMNSSNDFFSNMVTYIRSYATEYFENTGIRCTVNIAPDLPELKVDGELRRNVFLVVKEALNNVLKHANATQVLLVLSRNEQGIYFTIQDNGRGIDFENLRRFGIGLKNMKQRMEKFGIQFSIENNNGTLIKLYRPLNH